MMDVVVIDIPITYGMLLSRKWTAGVGGTLQMDLSHATIPNSNYEMVKVYREPYMKYHIEDPKDPNNEVFQETVSELFVLEYYFMTHEDLAYPDDEEEDDQYFGDVYDSGNYDEDLSEKSIHLSNKKEGLYTQEEA